MAVSFLEIVEGRLIQDGINLLEGQGVTDILVLPLFVSSGSTHVSEIAYALGVMDSAGIETDLERFEVKASIHYGLPMDDDPDIAQMVWDKVSHLSENPNQEAIIIVGHGSIHDGFRQRWEQGITSLAEKVKHISGVAAVDYALLNPDIIHRKVQYWQKEHRKQVIVAPLFLSEGYFIRTVIPRRLEGLDYLYSGQALLPHPLLTHWMDRQIETWLEHTSGTSVQLN